MSERSLNRWYVRYSGKLALLLLLVVGGAAFLATAREKRFVGQRSNGSVSVDETDHQLWDQLLREHVDVDGLVDYGKWQRSESACRNLRKYLGMLSKADLDRQHSQQGKLAFWINAYNALTIYGILQEYPTTSIRNHTTAVFGYNIWRDLQLFVDGQPYSLEQIEHQILRKMDEPRIHFAIVCASLGCPRLLNRAYTRQNILEQLENNARNFFQQSKNLQFNAAMSGLRLSEIVNWFADDFGKDSATQLKTLAQWMPSGPAQDLAASGSASVSFLDYDWRLNDQRHQN